MRLLFSKKKVHTSPARLGVRAFQSGHEGCQLLWIDMVLICRILYSGQEDNCEPTLMVATRTAVRAKLRPNTLSRVSSRGSPWSCLSAIEPGEENKAQEGKYLFAVC